MKKRNRQKKERENFKTFTIGLREFLKQRRRTLRQKDFPFYYNKYMFFITIS